MPVGNSKGNADFFTDRQQAVFVRGGSLRRSPILSRDHRERAVDISTKCEAVGFFQRGLDGEDNGGRIQRIMPRLMLWFLLIGVASIASATKIEGIIKDPSGAVIAG